MTSKYLNHLGASLIVAILLQPISMTIVAKAQAAPFVKVCNNGQAAGTGTCPAASTLITPGYAPNEWGCTWDNATKLLWEIKTITGWRDEQKVFTNYDNILTKQSRPNLSLGPIFVTQSQIVAANNSVTYVAAANQSKLCGFSNWRRPLESELNSIKVGTTSPAINTNYFPDVNLSRPSTAHYTYLASDPSPSPVQTPGLPDHLSGYLSFESPTSFAIQGFNAAMRDTPKHIRLVMQTDQLKPALSGGGGLSNLGGLGHIGDPIDRDPPTPSFTVKRKPLAAGRAHTCAITNTNTVNCWGSNRSIIGGVDQNTGQLGDGNSATTERLAPNPVSGLTNIAAIVAGSDHNCSLNYAGVVSCWGRNNVGQLGTGYPTSKFAPIAVTLPMAAMDITAGNNNTCALLINGSVWCWGRNDGNLLAVGGGATITQPTAVAFLPLTNHVIAIESGHAGTQCAIKSRGEVYCWGDNKYGQVGNGSSSATVPVTVPYLVFPAVAPTALKVSAITIGEYFTCALKTDTKVYCWGWNNGGQLGDGVVGQNAPAKPSTNVPPINGIGPFSSRHSQTTNDKISAINADGSHVCAIRTLGVQTYDRQAWCWGNNNWGKLGDQTNIGAVAAPHNPHVQRAPAAVENTYVPINHLIAIETGDNHSCALSSTGQIQCWGSNRFGELGVGVKTPDIANGTPNGTPVNHLVSSPVIGGAIYKH